MNGDVTVWCVAHRRRVLRDGETVYHGYDFGRCDSRWFRVRRVRRVRRESVLAELRAAERAQVRSRP